jgi:NAD(P)-dependent dehydrogenase (short-subunit alcohol dehydrogenase family)
MRDGFAHAICAVTGGAQGIGWATARAFAARGSRVYIADISVHHVREAQALADASPWPDRFHFTRCDVADQAQVTAWLAQIYHDTQRLDVLVNNAAFIRWQDVLDMSVADVERTMQVGFNAMVYTTTAVLPHMLTAGHGAIVNMGSSAGRLFVGSSSAAYAAVKAAVDGYTQTLQVELRRSKIHVMLVRPGTVAGTDFFRTHVPSSRMPRLADFVPPISADDVAAAIVRGLERRTPIVDVPGSLRWFYHLFHVAPNLTRRLVRIGGSARSDFSRPPPSKAR